MGHGRADCCRAEPHRHAHVSGARSCNVQPRYNVTGMFYFVKSGLIVIIVKRYTVFEESTIVCTSLTQELVDLPNLDLSVLSTLLWLLTSFLTQAIAF